MTKLFLSSTFKDLAEHRQRVLESLRTVRDLQVLAMEDWTAEPKQPLQLCRERVGEADLVVLILGPLYGFIPDGEAQSVTELEYAEAVAQAKPILAFVNGDLPVPTKLIRADPHLDRQDDFRERVLGDLTADLAWETPDQLSARVVSAVTNQIREMAVPADSVAMPGSWPPEVEAFLAGQHEINRHLDMAGFKTQVHMPIELESVRVPVTTQLSEWERRQRPRRGLAGRAQLLDAGDEQRGVLFEEVWHRAIARDVRGLVVLGAPGSGKTTLLRHLLLRAIADPAALGLESRVIPALLPLRQIDVKRALLLQLHSILGMEEAGIGEPLIRESLVNGEILLLLDGLDEVATGKARTRVSRWLEKELKKYPRCRWVVTSRIAGYVGESRLRSPLLEMRIERFREPEIREFLGKWFDCVATAFPKGTVESAKEAATARARGLADSVVANEQLYMMATNPLMLQIIALLHYDRGVLPNRRVELYDECTNVLLEYWDRAKEGMEQPLPLSAKEARRILQPVAYWMHGEPDRKYASTADLTPVLEEGLSAFPEKEIEPAQFLATVRDRSGLFVGYSEDDYGFQHLSFQEFLAAEEIRRSGLYTELVEVFGQSWWREVARLLMGLENPGCFEPFMTALLASDRFVSQSGHVTECVREAFEPDAAPFAGALLRSANGKRDSGRDHVLLQALAALPRRRLAPLADQLDGLRARIEDRQNAALLREVLAQAGKALLDRPAGDGLSEIIRNEVDGTDLVLIPAGAFIAGGDDFDDNPRREMELPAYYMARYPVTNEQYAAFLAANPDAEKPRYWDDEERNQPRQPVVGVSAHEAEAYCRWAGLRLAKEWEWEKAARGTDERTFPWGNNDPDRDRANFDRNVGRATEVGRYRAGQSPYGLSDMAGNVWEWTSSDYDDFDPQKRRERPKTKRSKRGKWRTLRGGAFLNGAGSLRCAVRDFTRPDDRSGIIGFRCAQDPVTP